MGKQTFDRAKQLMSILLLVSFVISVTAASVSAASSHANDSDTGIGGKTVAGHTEGSGVTTKISFADKDDRNSDDQESEEASVPQEVTGPF
jgi:hypothetical protein